MSDASEQSTITGRQLLQVLHTTFDNNGNDGMDAYLLAREFFVDGEWRTFDEADRQRHPGSPLFLFSVDHDAQVPMDDEIPVRMKDGPGHAA